jgi:hypothetical protein
MALRKVERTLGMHIVEAEMWKEMMIDLSQHLGRGNIPRISQA